MANQQAKQPRNQTTATPSQSNDRPAQEQLTFLEHIYELRTRLFWVFASVVAASSVGFYFKDLLIAFIKAPLDGEKLVYLTPGGGFSFIFTVCLYFGVLLTIPVIMYQLYRFLQPVFGRASRKLIAAIIILSSVLATAGAVFGYFVAIPAAIEFLTTFAGDAVAPSLTAESYLGFVVAYMLGLAVLFQLPLLLYIIDYVRPFPPGGLLSSQRYVLAGAIIAAAIITPTPDVINQAIVAGPIILVYQLGAIAVFLRHKSLQRAARRNLSRVPQQSAVEDTRLEEFAAEASQRRTASPRAVAPIVAPSTTSRETKSVSTVVKPAAAGRPASGRSIDGFAPRQSRQGLQVSVPKRAHSPRRLRSVDGLSFI